MTERGRGGVQPPLAWLSVPPATIASDGQVVAAVVLRGVYHDRAVLVLPACLVGSARWALEGWVEEQGWLPVPRHGGWPPSTTSRLAPAESLIRSCGWHVDVSRVLARVRFRAVMVSLRVSEAEFRATDVSALELLPLLHSPAPEVREGAVQATAWARPG